MNTRDIIIRLKGTKYKWTESKRIKEELRQLPISKRTQIRSELKEEAKKSDNNDIIDVINDIINDSKNDG